MSEEQKPELKTAEEIAHDVLANDPVKPDEKRWGMPEDQARQFFGLVYLGLERMSQRQRTMFRRSVKAASRDLDLLYPRGKSIDKIKEEAERAAREEMAKPKIIIPEGVNPESLKVKE